MQGDIGYIAPEMCAFRRGDRASYSPWSADVFSLGVCLYALVFGHLPTNASDAVSSMDGSTTRDIDVPNFDNRVLSSSLKVRTEDDFPDCVDISCLLWDCGF